MKNDRMGSCSGGEFPGAVPLRAGRATAAAVLVVAATYVYFLLFAEFALLRLAAPLAGRGGSLRAVMAVLGAGGVAGSVVAARTFRVERFRRTLAAGFLATAVAAGLALLAVRAGNAGFFAVAAGAVGLALGWLTVTLASGLRAAAGGKRLGLVCGAGTGLAYAVCNVPTVFESAAAAQTWIALAVVLAGAGATRWIEVRPAPAEQAGDFARGAAIVWVAVLLLLVWLDSAAFYIIQHAPAAKAATWSGTWRLAGNALTHLAAAVAAGWALDRGHAAKLAALATGVLVAGCLSLSYVSAEAVAPVLYTAGVSIYSTVLVWYPARGARPALAATVYAVSGWIGSAFGIGMAQDLQRVPGWFLALAVALVAGSLAVRARNRWWVAAIVTFAFFVPRSRADSAGEASIRRGRDVYIAEGCIHCHSQYVRPNVAADVERWGPAQPLAAMLAERPPLFGNRRQGPDLENVGNRRSPEWLRLHFVRPRALVPGSRMPSYAYLFSGDADRGDALVTYLSSLGRDAQLERLAQEARWWPAEGSAPGGRPRTVASGVPVLRNPQAVRLFGELCAACHGNAGRGDGKLAASLSVRPPDWTQEPWRHVPADEPDPETALARIIKFGLPGSPMAGHEYLSDADVVALSRLVETFPAHPHP